MMRNRWKQLVWFFPKFTKTKYNIVTTHKSAHKLLLKLAAFPLSLFAKLSLLAVALCIYLASVMERCS